MANRRPDAEIGIFARTFPRASLGETLDAVESSGFDLVQLNLSSAGLETLPAALDPATLTAISEGMIRGRFLGKHHIVDRHRPIRVAALSGTFNMIDPDLAKRRENLRKLDVLAGVCRSLGTSIITLCTGTRDPSDMWKRHPDNDDPSAWADLLEAMREATRTAEYHNVTIAFEPEIGNVVNSTAKARKLLDEAGSPCLKVVLDLANLIRPDEIPRMRAIIDEAFDLLAPDVAILHAKEIAADGSVGDVAPGKGVLDFAHIAARYHQAGLDAPIIIHGLPESSASESKRFLMKKFAFPREVRRFDRDGLSFRYVDVNSDEPLAFVFQHGLGGDVSKMYDLIEPPPGVRLISFDARYHGETRPLGPPETIGFDQSSDDLLALLDHLGIEKAVIGGLSMGAGIALNFATRYPERTLGLILSRPAWIDEPFPENVRMFPEMAALVRQLGARAARDAFRKSETYARTLAESSDSAATLLGMFDDPTCEETVAKYERIPRDCPSRDRSAWRAITVPTLVLANHQDPIHPYAIAPVLASVIPRADLRLLTPKCVDVQEHERDFNGHIHQYLERNFPTLTRGLSANRTDQF